MTSMTSTTPSPAGGDSDAALTFTAEERDKLRYALAIVCEELFEMRCRIRENVLVLESLEIQTSPLFEFNRGVLRGMALARGVPLAELLQELQSKPFHVCATCMAHWEESELRDGACPVCHGGGGPIILTDYKEPV